MSLLSSCNSKTTGAQINWEGKGARTVVSRIFVEILDKASLPQKLSPSMAEYIPNPVRLTAKVIDGDIFKPGQIVFLDLSEYELKDLGKSSKAVIGLLSENVAICIEKADENTWRAACKDTHTP